MSFPFSFYVKIGVAGSLLGAAMEGFMIKTGFYDKVTQIEAERLEESREQRQAFQTMFQEELERQAQEKGLHINLPPKSK